MNAERIAVALGGRKSASNWSARCPVHEDRQPSLSIADGKEGRVLVHCFAGCAARDVIAVLKARGLWSADHPRSPTPMRMQSRQTTEPDTRAMKIWSEAVEATGTLVASYLRKRGITLAPPPSLRFHARLWHNSQATCPAMVALVTNAVTGEPMAIHRTYLDHTGHKSNLDPNKMMLGPTAGGIVRLGDDEHGLLVGEGIETVLSGMQATGRPGWAALSTSGLKALVLPDHVREVTILADGDPAGLKAAREATSRWTTCGVRVSIAKAPDGRDFNDLIQDSFSSKGIIRS